MHWPAPACGPLGEQETRSRPANRRVGECIPLMLAVIISPRYGGLLVFHLKCNWKAFLKHYLENGVSISDSIAEAVVTVVVDQPGSLEMRVHRDGAEKGKTPLLEILAHLVRQVIAGDNHRTIRVARIFHSPVVGKLPQIGREGPKLRLDP